MLKFPSSAEGSALPANHDSRLGSPAKPRTFVEVPGAGWRATSGPRTFIRRRLSPESGRALEILGHAIEYLADEYAADREQKGPLGSADPRVEAIQILKSFNRAIYYSGTEVQPAIRRVKRWLLGLRTN